MLLLRISTIALLRLSDEESTLDYLERSNYLFRTGNKQYRDLLSAINTNIDSQSRLEESKKILEASKLGLTIWEDLKALVNLIKAKSLHEIGHESAYDLLYWALTQADNLAAAARKDAELFEPYFQFCKEYTDMHEGYLDREIRNLGNIRQHLAECYCRKGHFDACDALYEDWLEREPIWYWGWIGWSDCYWLFNISAKKNYAKAEKILNKGLSVPDIDKEMMLDRLNDLQREKVKQTLSVVK